MALLDEAVKQLTSLAALIIIVCAGKIVFDMIRIYIRERRSAAITLLAVFGGIFLAGVRAITINYSALHLPLWFRVSILVILILFAFGSFRLIQEL